MADPTDAPGPYHRLSGLSRANVHEALLDAFPTRAALEQLADFELNENLNEIADQGNLKDAAFQLIRWAESRGRLPELLEAARKRNSENPRLKALGPLQFESKRRVLPGLDRFDQLTTAARSGIRTVVMVLVLTIICSVATSMFLRASTTVPLQPGEVKVIVMCWALVLGGGAWVARRLAVSRVQRPE